MIIGCPLLAMTVNGLHTPFNLLVKSSEKRDIPISWRSLFMRTKMSPRRALLTAVIMSIAPTLLFFIASAKVSFYGALIASILINWPVIRLLDDRQWYREWKREESR